MFPARYFGPRYFAGRYFGAVGSAGGDYFGDAYFAARYWPDRYFGSAPNLIMPTVRVAALAAWGGPSLALGVTSNHLAAKGTDE